MRDKGVRLKDKDGIWNNTEMWTVEEVDLPNVEFVRIGKGNMVATMSGIAIFSYYYAYNKFVHKVQSSVKNKTRISEIRRLIRRPLHLSVWSVFFSVVKQNRSNQCMYLECLLLSLRPLLQLPSLSVTNDCNNFWLGKIDTWVEVSFIRLFSSTSSSVFSVSTTSSRLFRSDDAGLCLLCHLPTPSSSLYMVLTLLTDSSSPLCLSFATVSFSIVMFSFSSIAFAINDVEVDSVEKYVDFRCCLPGSLQFLNFWVWGMLVILPERWNYDWEEFHLLGGLRNRRDYKIISSVRKHCRKGNSSKARWLVVYIHADRIKGMQGDAASWVEVDKFHELLGTILIVCYREDKFELSSAKKGICGIGSLIGTKAYATRSGFVWDYKSKINVNTLGGRNLFKVGASIIKDRKIKDRDCSSLTTVEVIIINIKVNVRRKGNLLRKDKRKDSYMQTDNKKKVLYKCGIEEKFLSINTIVNVLNNDCEWFIHTWVSRQGIRKEYITRIVVSWLTEHSRNEKVGFLNRTEVKGRKAANKREKNEDRRWNNVATKLFNEPHVWHNHYRNSRQEVKEVSKEKYTIHRVERNRKRKQAIRAWNVISRYRKCRIINKIREEKREVKIQKNPIVDRSGSSISRYKSRDRRMIAVIINLRFYERRDSPSQIKFMWQIGGKINNKDQLIKSDTHTGKLKGRSRMEKVKMLNLLCNCLGIKVGYCHSVKSCKTEKSKQLRTYKHTRDSKRNWRIIAVWDDNLKGDISNIRVKIRAYDGYKNSNGKVKRNFDRGKSMPIHMEGMGYVKGRRSKSRIFKSCLEVNFVEIRSKTCLWHDVSTVEKGANLMIRSEYKESSKEWDRKTSTRRTKIIVNLSETSLSNTYWNSNTPKKVEWSENGKHKRRLLRYQLDKNFIKDRKHISNEKIVSCSSNEKDPNLLGNKYKRFLNSGGNGCRHKCRDEEEDKRKTKVIRGVENLMLPRAYSSLRCLTRSELIMKVITSDDRIDNRWKQQWLKVGCNILDMKGINWNVNRGNGSSKSKTLLQNLRESDGNIAQYIKNKILSQRQKIKSSLGQKTLVKMCKGHGRFKMYELSMTQKAEDSKKYNGTMRDKILRYIGLRLIGECGVIKDQTVCEKIRMKQSKNLAVEIPPVPKYQNRWSWQKKYYKDYSKNTYRKIFEYRIINHIVDECGYVVMYKWKNTNRRMKEKLGVDRSIAVVWYLCYCKIDINCSIGPIWRNKGIKGQILEDIKMSMITIKGYFKITKRANELVRSNLENWVDNLTNGIISRHKRYNSYKTGLHNLGIKFKCKWRIVKGNSIIQIKYREGRGSNRNKEEENYTLSKTNNGNRNG